MNVEEVMSTGLLTVREDEDVRTAVEKMVARHCGAIPVVDEQQRLVGIVTIRDIVLPLYPNCGQYIHDEVHTHYFTEMESEYAQVLNRRASEVMTPRPMSVAPEDPVLKAASYMGVKNLRRMPVTENGRLVGMVSIGDINRALFMEYVNQVAPLRAAGG